MRIHADLEPQTCFIAKNYRMPTPCPRGQWLHRHHASIVPVMAKQLFSQCCGAIGGTGAVISFIGSVYIL